MIIYHDGHRDGIDFPSMLVRLSGNSHGFMIDFTIVVRPSGNRRGGQRRWRTLGRWDEIQSPVFG